MVVPETTAIAIITTVGVVVAALVTAVVMTFGARREREADTSVATAATRVIPGHWKDGPRMLPWMPRSSYWVEERYERLAEFRDGTRRWLPCSHAVFQELSHDPGIDFQMHV